MSDRPRTWRPILFGLAGIVLLITVCQLPIPAQPAAQAAAIDPDVYDALAAAPDGQARFIVLFTGRADLSGTKEIRDWSERGRAVMQRLRAAADRSQRDVHARMAGRNLPGRITAYQPFWIANAIAVTGDRAAVEALARFPGVAEILPEMKLDTPEQPIASIAPEADQTWGIEKIGADQVWSVYGARGEGVVIGLVDTGVQWDHPALKGQYRGWDGKTANHNYNWWDPAHFCGAAGSPPCDSSFHGTHTTGIAAGGNSTLEGPIGVAPGARWIHAAGCCASNASLLSSLQWMLAPTDLYGNDPDPSRRPSVVNNSWGGPGGSKIFFDVISALAAAGIVPIFSAGNSGSACGTLGSPGDTPAAFNAGNTTSTDDILPGSSRGPNPFTGDTGPHVSAPGTGIYSAAPPSSYTVASGTSMAAPHVAGSVALLLSVEPDLLGKVDQIEELLRKTAVQLTDDRLCGGVPGSQIPNNTFGWGRINVKAAADLIANAGTFDGRITDAATHAPLAGATVSISRNGYTLTQKTGADGRYGFTAGAGTYQVKAEAFGYAAQIIPGISVTQDAVTMQDFALGILTTGGISGSVVESGTSTPVQGAVIELIGSTLSTTTATDGSYALSDAPFGAYTARMTSPGYQTLTAGVAVDGAETLDFAPAAAPDYVVGDGGDTCSAGYTWIDATGGTAHNLGDDASTSVTLPWSFTFYGNSYTTLFISSNGFVSFGDGYSRWHGIVPFEGPPNNQIIGLGEDLNPAGGTQGQIYTRDMGDGRFVIEYHAVEHWANGNPETFEIILNNHDDTILVQYRTVSWPAFANAGIENANGSRGIQYSYANDLPLDAGLAVKYTPFMGRPPICAPTRVFLPLILDTR